MSVLTVPITETPNELTLDIDLASPEGVLRILRQTDAQVFNGWRDLPAIYDPSIVASLVQVSKAVSLALNQSKLGKRGLIIMTGSGTSGRVAWLTARAFNRVFAAAGLPKICRYLASGGDPALLLSDELPEDDPLLGQRELISACEGYDEVVFIGISCGVSAPYAVGQADWAMNQPNFTTVLMGFNPAHLARAAAVEGWDKCCKDVAMALEARRDERRILLNPALGPEPITGSTRMKGGTATKILLELALTAGWDLFRNAALDVEAHIITLTQQFEAAVRRMHLQGPHVAAFLQAAGESLRSGGHLYYIGAGVGGLMGIVDSSEMVDTYGADASEVRGFVPGGWAAMENYDGPSVREKSIYCHISEEDFLSEILPTLSPKDCVIFINVEGEAFPSLPSLIDVVSKAPHGTLGLLSVGVSGIPAVAAFPGLTATIAVPTLSPVDGCLFFAEIALKLALNAISTGAQIMKGCVYMNRMINVGVLNNKLYYRSIDLVAQFSGATPAAAETALLSSIHEVDDVTAEIRALPTSQHIITATDKKNVVPIAMLLATGMFNRASAAEALRKEPVLRTLVAKLHAEHKKA